LRIREQRAANLPSDAGEYRVPLHPERRNASQPRYRPSQRDLQRAKISVTPQSKLLMRTMVACNFGLVGRGDIVDLAERHSRNA
jgi:hypothetical protein